MRDRLLINLIFPPIFVICLLSTAIPTDSARAQECAILICKHAASAQDGTLFPFIVREGNSIQTIEVEANGPCYLLDFNASASLIVIEAPFPGWKLDELFCILPPDINVDFADRSVELTCVGSETSMAGTCNFFNAEGTETAAIPTLSEWGMIAAAGVLGLVGVYFVIRRRKAQAV